MSEMSMGSNIELPTTSVRATLRWTGGASVPDVDASALLLDGSGKVGAEADFVFYNQPRHPGGAVVMAGRTPAPDAADALDIDLARLAESVVRVVLAASADGGGTFGAVPDLRLDVADARGSVLATFPMRADVETAFVCAEFYRRNGAWRFRAIGQGYASGLAGLAADFGIDAVGSSPAPQPSEPQPSAPQPSAPRATTPAAGGPDPLLDLDRPAGSLGL